MNIIKTVGDLKKALSVYDDALPLSTPAGKPVVYTDLCLYRLDRTFCRGEISFVLDVPKTA